MSRSVFHDSHRRETFGGTHNNGEYWKHIPDIGIENFECRSTQAFHLPSLVDVISPPFACDFSPRSHDIILIAQEDGLVHMYDTSSNGSDALIQDYEAHANAVFDVKWLSPGTSFLTGSGDQSIRRIDAECGTVLQLFFGHTMSVRSLSVMPSDYHIFASASRDGSIRLWDIRLKSDTVNIRGIAGTSSVGLLSQCHVPNWTTNTDSGGTSHRRPRTPSRRLPTDAQSVTTVVFMNDNTLLSAGSTDGSIKMWDLRRLFSINSKKQAKAKAILPYRGLSQKRSGYSDLRLDSMRTRLYANCLDSNVYEYDLTRPSTSPIFVYAGHQADSFYIKLDVSPDDRHIICGSSDRRAHIYAVGEQRQRPVVLSGHTGEVSVPCWSKSDPSRIVTLSDDSHAYVWNMFPARRYTLPKPGELAGLAERLPPSKAIMSPTLQEKRVLRSPGTLTCRSRQHHSHDNLMAVSPSAASAKRRQSNIRSFLAVISPPETTSVSVTSRKSPATARMRNPATLPETLGGVVQRFPGHSFGLQAITPTSTPVCGFCPLGMKRDSAQTPSCPIRVSYNSCTDLFPSDESDTENISPNRLRGRGLTPTVSPLDYTDETGLTNSPIICCTNNRLLQTPETPPVSSTRRTPLALRQSLSSPSSQMMDHQSARKRLRSPRTNEPLTPPSPSIHQDANSRLFKRRRLTVCATHDQRPSSPLATPPRTPTSLRRRRMTTYDPAFSNRITEYFKPHD